MKKHAGRISEVAYGCIETKKDTPKPLRLAEIFDTLSELLHTHTPECLAIEDLYFSTNAKTAIGVGESRGVIILAAAKIGIPVISYSPLTVKQTITGDGKADKKQVERMVLMTLGMKQAPKPDDTVDALAIAMTHAYSYKFQKTV